jgi:4-hydroxy-3-polyprenylbenzoate decarboxylase
VLRRVDWRRDLHFHTNTTIDTLDYSGDGLNMGSKVVIAAAGPPIRELVTELPPDLRLPEGFREPRIVMPGVVAVEGSGFRVQGSGAEPALDIERWTLDSFPLVVAVDDSDFASRNLANFLWVTFTRANPAADIHGIGSFTDRKHWGCTGSLVIDARIKPHHAPPLVEDAEVSRRIDALASRGGPLAKWL